MSGWLNCLIESVSLQKLRKINRSEKRKEDERARYHDMSILLNKLMRYLDNFCQMLRNP